MQVNITHNLFFNYNINNIKIGKILIKFYFKILILTNYILI